MFSRGPSPLRPKIRFPMHVPLILNGSFLPREKGWEVSVEHRSEPTNYAARNSRVSRSPQEAHSLAFSGIQGHQALVNHRCWGDSGRTAREWPYIVGRSGDQ